MLASQDSIEPKSRDLKIGKLLGPPKAEILTLGQGELSSFCLIQQWDTAFQSDKKFHFHVPT